MKIWCQVMAQGFEMPDFVAEAFTDFMRYADPNIMMLVILPVPKCNV